MKIFDLKAGESLGIIVSMPAKQKTETFIYGLVAGFSAEDKEIWKLYRYF